MSWERHGGLRAAIAQQAAQIMYAEEVKQYFTAKRIAAKRLLGQAGARGLRYRPRDLPSNGEIKDALLALVIEIEGETRIRRLFAMRIAALEAMEELTQFDPRLIGSVATGHVRSGSDVDLHVFAHDPEDVAMHVQRLGWSHEIQRVSIMKQGKVQEFVHVLVADVFPLELTVYAPRELRFRPRSSTDGKPIVRIKSAALRALIAREHSGEWGRYLESGEVPSLDELMETEEDESGREPAVLADDDEGDDGAPLGADWDPLDGAPCDGDEVRDDGTNAAENDGDGDLDEDEARGVSDASARRRSRAKAREQAESSRR